MRNRTTGAKRSRTKFIFPNAYFQFKVEENKKYFILIKIEIADGLEM